MGLGDLYVCPRITRPEFKQLRELTHIVDAFHLLQGQPRVVGRFLAHCPAGASGEFRAEFFAGKPSGISPGAVTALAVDSSITQPEQDTAGIDQP